MGKQSAGGLRLSLGVMPAVVAALVLVITGLVIDHFGKSYFRDELYGPHLVWVVSQKRQDIDAWCAVLKGEVAALAAHPSVIEHLSRPDRPSTASRVSTLFMERTSPDRHMLLVLLSPEGRVVAASHERLLRQDWSDSKIMKSHSNSSQPASVAGLLTLNQLDGIGVAASVKDKGGVTRGVLVSVVSPESFADRLRIERGLYRTEEIDMISRDGETLLTAKGVPKGKVKYTVQWSPSQGIREHGTVVYTLEELKEAPFGLIGSVVTEEFLSPLRTALLSYAACGILIVLAVLAYCIWAVRHAVTRPLAGLVGAVNAAAGGAAFDPGGAGVYRGQIGALAGAITRLLGEGRRTGSAAAVSEGPILSAPPAETETGTVAGGENIQGDIRANLEAIREAAASMRGLRAEVRPEAVRIADRSQSTLLMLDLVSDLERIREGSAPLATSVFALGDLMKEVQDEARLCLAHKDVAFVYDADDPPGGQTVCYDRNRLRRLLVTLTCAAATSIYSGVITVFSAKGRAAGRDTLDISVMAVPADVEAESPRDRRTTGDDGLWLLASDMARQMRGALTRDESGTFCVSLPLSDS